MVAICAEEDMGLRRGDFYWQEEVFLVAFCAVAVVLP